MAGERFRIERVLGEGGFGRVYAVYDELRRARVAMKTVRSPQHALVLKREFRALSERRHRNLVQLYELHGRGAEWFFTMELFEGPPLREHLGMRSSNTTSEASPSQLIAPRDEEDTLRAGAPRVPHARRSPQQRPAQPERLRSTLAQIAQGLSYLHSTGTLHLDVKPSNVLVGLDGRVVLADFGFAQPQRDLERFVDDAVIVGTPAYMAPELIHGLTVGPSADAYSLGVLLYEALTAKLPFVGTVPQALAQKEQPLRPVRELAPDAPPELAALCDALLHRDPAARASLQDVLRALGEQPPSTTVRSIEASSLVGRDDELRALASWLEEATRGPRAIVAVIDAPSGGGKTSLVQSFIASSRARALSCRCRADEWVAFEAVDGIVDRIAELSPSAACELGLLFPAAFGESVERSNVDRVEARRRGFDAFREALRRLTVEAPTILWIDDAQWGDADSGALLGEALRGPDAPPVLLVLTARRDANLLLLDALLEATGEQPPALRRLALAPLDEAASSALVERVAPHLSAPQRAAIVEAGRGNPFFLDALARHGGAQQATSIEPWLHARIERLSSPSRSVLSALCLAGHPLPRAAVSAIAHVRGADELEAIASLREARLITVFRERGEERLDAWHDRVRESAVSALCPEAKRDLHERIARYLLTQRPPDALALMHHLAGAERRYEAAQWAEQAAKAALDQGAFDQAARALERAIELGAPPDRARRTLLERVGECWVLAGRAALAASAFEQAAALSAREDKIVLEQRAASLLLGAGHIERGLALMRDVLAAVGQSLPRARPSVVAHLALARTRLLARGLAFRARNEREIPRDELLKLDAFQSVASGLSLVDTAAGAYFSTLHLREALRVGEPRHVAIALASEQCFLAGRGELEPRADERAVSELLELLARKLQDRDIDARVLFARGTAAFLRARWADAVRDLEACLARWQGIAGVDHERVTCEHFVLAARTWMGQHRAVARRLPKVLRDAREAGDLYAESTIETAIGHVPSLVADDPDGADAVLTRGISRWSQQGFFIQHYDEMVARADVTLYRGHGRGAQALAALRARWPALRGSLLRNVQVIAAESDYALGRALVAALACESPRWVGRRSALRELASRTQALIERALPWSVGLGHCLGAALAVEEGLHRRAIAELREAERQLARAEVESYRAAAMLYRGSLSGDRAALEEARATLRAEGVVAPDRFAVAFVPGRR